MKSLAIKGLLSLALLWHLVAIVVAPNPDSILHRQLSPILLPYVNFLSVNTTWRFFSPNPMMRSLEYRAFTYTEDGDVIETESTPFPSVLQKSHSRESYNRRMNFAMFMTSRQDLMEGVLAPILCKRHPGAQEVGIYQIQHNFPPVEAARLESKFETTARKDLVQTVKVHMGDISCPGS